MLDNTFSPDPDALLHHGGRLLEAAACYGIPPQHWIDLSTGINPDGWQPANLPADVWARLPQNDDGLIDAAREYYSAIPLLPVAGSQAAILALPRLRASGSVAVLHPGYSEHAQAWKRTGHTVHCLDAATIGRRLHEFEVVVVARPNNPTGECLAEEQILQWHRQLAARGGWLVVDEAFIDTTPQRSITPLSSRQGLITLRSPGKFFGLAGARVGFVISHPTLLNALQCELGPWTVCSASRHVVRQALLDTDWQQRSRTRLQQQGRRLQQLLERYDLRPDGGCALFQWCTSEHAPKIHHQLARRGILTRLFDAPHSLRFGLPAGEDQWQRLDDALQCAPV